MGAKNGVLISPKGKENAVCGVVFDFRCVISVWEDFTGKSSVSKLYPNVVNR
ncbi:hypothetical protein G5A97_07215 [[Clostridium] symbiosum]|uniref:hypothetical protein n=1 Tax=Lachnospiraceae TaxID=186803 RepID=UPI00031BE280|nr:MULTISPECIES: hypothetical protein [Lachnoclostridium]MCB6647402.1 hypothetical protein [[Clostridium] scindens]MDB2023028.1 hypothetical protein [[Clostridium] symbiosum]NSI95076.1 hypothetical protein [[Clostridium] symbiosum]